MSESETSAGRAPGRAPGSAPGSAPGRADERYRLDEQVGYQLRRANQRHVAIFAARISDLTPTQFATLARLAELGPQSQNALGRATAMDAATIKGVIDRLQARGLVTVSRSKLDRRRVAVTLTELGAERFAEAAAAALEISEETLAPLAPEEREVFLRLLSKLG